MTKNHSGYQFQKRDRMIVDPLCVGKASMFEKVSIAIANSEFKADVKVRVVRGYTNIYLFKPKKLDGVLEFLKNLIK